MRKRHNSGSTKVNEQINSDAVRLISNVGENLGVFDLDAALQRAEMEELDLIEVAPSAEPPVCKIMDYGKYKYRQQKKEKKQKKNQVQTKLKELQFTIRIEEHDIKTKLRRAKSFFDDGCKIRIVVTFRGRENIYREKGFELTNKLVERLSNSGEIDVPPKLDNGRITTILRPK